MNYTLTKIILVIVAAALALFGIVVIGVPLISDGHFEVKSLGMGIIPMGMAFASLLQLRRVTRFQTMNYDWYKSIHPKHVVGNRVTCVSCGSARIRVRALMNRTYTREHFCTQCGKTLHYSPEQSH